ncbi:MAG: dTDP-4-amino-4,6-dideoxygalactose transaminase [Roseivirga sp.]|jgi:dTDP-4-amino-4,6-dideoxygalactose transaminase
MQIPFLDLKRQYFNIQNQIDQAISTVLKNQIFLGGDEVSKFEITFAQLHGVNHTVGVANATDALFIILKSLALAEGDEVIVPAHGWLSAAEMVRLTGATVIFVDVETDSFGLDPSKLQSKINANTKAVIAIHLYGQICKIEEISRICKSNGISLIEDCAQAHFASLNGQSAGQWGLASAFSFYPSKILGAYGDGGAILTNDPDFANHCRMYANHGGLTKNQHYISGINSRLDSIQAAILNIKMNYVHEWIEKRSQIADYYTENLKKIREIVTPNTRKGSQSNFHIYTLRTENRDDLKSHLEKSGVSTEIHYPLASPYTKAFDGGFKPEDFPVSYQLQNEMLSLPIYPELTVEEMAYIVKQIKAFFE